MIEKEKNKKKKFLMVLLLWIDRFIVVEVAADTVVAVAAAVLF